MTDIRLLDTFPERWAAHTTEERELAEARVRVSGVAFRRIERLYEEAVRERKDAAAHAAAVGVSVRRIAALLEINQGPAGRLLKRKDGERTVKS